MYSLDKKMHGHWSSYRGTFAPYFVLVETRSGYGKTDIASSTL